MSAKKPNFEFEDFLSDDVEAETGLAINPKAKLLNFAKIKVSVIDPRIHKEIDESMRRIEKNLQKLKALVRE
jgi:hypothetical protein